MSKSLVNLSRTLILSLTAVIAGTSLPVHAQDVEATFASSNVVDGIYMLSSATGFTGGNIAVMVGDDGVAVIDNGMPNVLDKLRAEVAKLTDQPVDYLINTHEHGDHTGNNAAFAGDGARLISHRNLRAALARKTQANESGETPLPESALPVITFTDEMTLYINGDLMRIIHLENAHTDGDAVIYFDASNVIHTGDIMFNGLFPYIDASNGGSLDGMIAALGEIARIGNDESKIIPGHGPMANKEDVASTIAMLEDVKTLVSALVADGKTDEEILAANPLSVYQDYNWGFITTERMTNQVINSVRGL